MAPGFICTNSYDHTAVEKAPLSAQTASHNHIQAFLGS